MTEFADHTSRRLDEIRPGSVPSDVELIIEQQVTDGDMVVDRFHIWITNGGATVVAGAAAQPHVTIRQDIETARALRAGEIHAQRAFLTGRLSIDGDMDRLLAHGPLLSALLGTTHA